MTGEKAIVRGVVLRGADSKESDRILTVLTAEQGKISVVAKGARSRRSRYLAASQDFAFSELVLTERHGFFYLAEASTIALFPEIARDVVLLSLAAYFSELTEAVTYDGMESGEILSLFLNALYALGNLGKDQTLVKAAFELRLMLLTGFAPLVEDCAFCGASMPKTPMLNVVDGILHCKDCRRGGGLSMPLTPASVEALRHILFCDPARLYAFTLPREDLKLLSHAAEAFVAAQLERGFHTLDFYKKLDTNCNN